MQRGRECAVERETGKIAAPTTQNDEDWTSLLIACSMMRLRYAQRKWIGNKIDCTLYLKEDNIDLMNYCWNGKLHNYFLRWQMPGYLFLFGNNSFCCSCVLLLLQLLHIFAPITIVYSHELQTRQQQQYTVCTMYIVHNEQK